MQRRFFYVIATLLTLSLSWAAYASHSIPEDKLEAQKIYYGVTSNFSKAAEVDFEVVVRATPEYQEIRDSNIERGTGKYWILMSRASDRSNSAITTFGRESDYDIIAAKGYLESVDSDIPVEDITSEIVKKIEEG